MYVQYNKWCKLVLQAVRLKDSVGYLVNYSNETVITIHYTYSSESPSDVASPFTKHVPVPQLISHMHMCAYCACIKWRARPCNHDVLTTQAEPGHVPLCLIASAFATWWFTQSSCLLSSWHANRVVLCHTLAIATSLNHYAIWCSNYMSTIHTSNFMFLFHVFVCFLHFLMYS
jgi:hypothetical protein